MEIRLFTIAKSVQAYPDGTFSILNGGIQEIGSPTFPAVFPITLFVRIEADPRTDLGTHQFSISVRDQDGRVVEVPVTPEKKAPLRVEGTIRTERKPGAPVVEGKPDLINFGSGINLLAEKPGSYYVWVEINGKTQQLPLKVSQIFIPG